MLLGAGLPALSTGAAAAVSTLYVNNAASAHCSDAGSGTQAVPYCRVTAAAAVVLPGQTVDIAAGTYNDGTLTITRSGTEQAPITFRGPAYDVYNPGGTATIGSTAPGRGIVVQGAQHIRFTQLTAQSTELGLQREAIVLDDAHDVSFTRVGTWSGGLRVSNGSSGVTFAQGQFSYASGPVARVDSGSTGTVLSTNMIRANSNTDRTGVLVSDAPGTVVVSNTVESGCFPGIAVKGASSGAVVENNVVNTADNGAKACVAGSQDTGISLDPAAVAGSKFDYNVVSPASGGPAYSWDGATFTTQQAFTAATGQGAHDFIAVPTFSRGADGTTSPLIDSADETAPGMVDGDAWGRPAADHPIVPNTGTGSGFRDRGAQEDYDFGSLFTPAGPTRLLDTRLSIGVPQAAPVAAYGTVDLQVAGVAGIPSTGVTAVTLNVTVTDPTQAGHLTVYPHGGTAPDASNLNWTAGTTIPNLVTVPVKDGKVSLANVSSGTTHVIADLAGYYSAQGQDMYHPVGPLRAIDTRAYWRGETAERLAGPVPARGTLDLDYGGTPNVSSVTLNVTVTEPGGPGHLTVYPHGSAAPDSSNLNWTTGQTIANQVVVPIKDGKLSFYNASDTPLHLVVDVFGYQAP